jgi:hypothetical protein
MAAPDTASASTTAKDRAIQSIALNMNSASCLGPQFDAWHRMPRIPIAGNLDPLSD